MPADRIKKLKNLTHKLEQNRHFRHPGINTLRGKNGISQQGKNAVYEREIRKKWQFSGVFRDVSDF